MNAETKQIKIFGVKDQEWIADLKRKGRTCLF